MLFLQFFVVYWDLEKKFKIFFFNLFLRNGFLKKVSELNWTLMHFQEWKKGLLTQFRVVTLCTNGFLKFHQHKMTIENNFITIDKIDTCPAFHLIYRGSPDNTNFGPPGDRTIAKIVLCGDWFSTKIRIWDF